MELYQITRTRQYLSILNRKMSKFSQKYYKILSNVHKTGGAHFPCMNNYNAKFDYKGMRIAGVIDYTDQTLPKQFKCKNV